MRRRARVDANQSAIVETLRAAGAKVEFLSPLGNGVPDLLVAFRGRWYVVEVKDGSLAPSRKKLTPFERAWHDQFSLQAPILTIHSSGEAYAVIILGKEPL